MNMSTNRWIYNLPDGRTADNMKTAKIMMGVSKTRFVGMLKSGHVTRQKSSEQKPLKGYENTTGISQY